MRIFRLELKRVLKTRMTWILLIVSLLLTGVMAYLPITFHGYHWTESDGQEIEVRGLEFVKYTKESQKDYTGEVTPRKIRLALEEYQDCMQEYNATETYDLPQEVYMKRIYPVLGILHGVKEIFADPNTGVAPSLIEIDPEQVENYYAGCNSRLISLMNMEQKNNPSAQKKAKELYNQVEKPYLFYPGYSTDAIDYQILLSILIVVFCAVIAAPIFTSDYQTGADDILRCTKFGRRHLAVAKIASALCISGLAFVICLALYILISDSLFGWETTKTSIQMLYSITTLAAVDIGQFQITTALLTVLPLLATISIILFISSNIRNNAVAMAISLLVCIAPNILSGFLTRNIGAWILYAFPSSAFGIQTNLMYSAVGFEFLHLGNMSFRPTEVMIFFSIIEIPVFILLTIHSYSKNRVIK